MGNSKRRLFKRRMARTLVVVVTVLSAVGLAACGGGASDEELAQAEKNGEAKARQEIRLKILENKLDKGIKSLKNQGGGSTSEGGEPNPPGTSTTSGSTDCGDGLSVNSVTTCEFAENVRYVYENTIAPSAGTVQGYSPTRNLTYDMYCTAGTPHECTGGDEAALYFP